MPNNIESKTSPRILVVEDEILVRMFAVDALEDVGFKVEEAATASEALDKLNPRSEDLCAAVIDLGLPDRSGDQLATEILALHPDLPILVASGRSERELKDRFSGAKHVMLLVKPYTASMLLDALADLGVKPPEKDGTSP